MHVYFMQADGDFGSGVGGGVRDATEEGRGRGGLYYPVEESCDILGLFALAFGPGAVLSE